MQQRYNVRVTVAILAQGTSWAVAVTQAFFVPGSIFPEDNLWANKTQAPCEYCMTISWDNVETVQRQY
jgi:hypothetical protein